MKQLGLMIDMKRCIGCKTCIAACRNANGLTDPAALPGEMPAYLRVESERRGTYPKLSVQSRVIPCQHCVNPKCLKACKAGAISKDAQTGVVLIDREKCRGGGDCVKACPYGVIQFDAARRKASKCDLCFARIHLGQRPVCVETCLTDAISFGEKALLKQAALDAGREIVKKLSAQSVLYVA